MKSPPLSPQHSSLRQMLPLASRRAPSPHATLNNPCTPISRCHRLSSRCCSTVSSLSHYTAAPSRSLSTHCFCRISVCSCSIRYRTALLRS